MKKTSNSRMFVDDAMEVDNGPTRVEEEIQFDEAKVHYHISVKLYLFYYLDLNFIFVLP